MWLETEDQSELPRLTYCLGACWEVALCVNVSLHIPDALLSDRTFLTHTLLRVMCGGPQGSPLTWSPAGLEPSNPTKNRKVRSENT